MEANNTQVMDLLIQYLPFIIPLAIIQVGLLIAALVHIFKHTKYRTGSRTLWVIVSICVNMIGPILYFAIGRGEE